MKLMGMPVVVLRPVTESVLRGWRERLASWPWRPWQRRKIIVTPPPMKPGEYYIAGGLIYCDEIGLDRLRREIAASPTDAGGEGR